MSSRPTSPAHPASSQATSAPSSSPLSLSQDSFHTQPRYSQSHTNHAHKRNLKHSSSEKGFFQEPPKLGNQYADDFAFQRVLSFYLPPTLSQSQELQQDLFRLAQVALSQRTANCIEDAERDLPTLRGSEGMEKEELLDVWGRKRATFVERSEDSRNERGPRLRTSQGWKKLGEWGAKEGVIAIGYENEFGPYSRLVQFAKLYFYAPSSALQVCPLAMTDGAARLLKSYSRVKNSPIPATPSSIAPLQLALGTSSQPGAEQIFREAHNRLISRGGPNDPPRWISGQWMTERPGGSDVSNTETVAHYSPVTTEEMGEMGLGSGQEHTLGPWIIDGYKFFTSAADADMTILLAKTQGKEGLSAFYAPLKRKKLLHLPAEQDEYNETALHNGYEQDEPEEDQDWEWNGVKIIRLKKKLGTRAVATGEIEVQGMRGWLIGEEGKGLAAMHTILNITRVHNSVIAVALMRRGLAASKAFALVRRVKNQVLAEIPLHLRTLAHMEVVFRANLHLSFFTASLFGLSEHPDSLATVKAPHAPTYSFPSSPSPSMIDSLLLILIPLAKSLTAKNCINILSEVMESLGGVGYLQNEEYGGMNVQRLYRDANVLSIWEGTTNVLATELVRSLLRRVEGGRLGVNVLSDWVETNLGETYALPDMPGAVSVLEKCKLTLWGSFQKLETRVSNASKEELIAGGRELVVWLGYAICGVLLLLDARRDGDIISVEVCRRWVIEGAGKGGMVGVIAEERLGEGYRWNERAERDYLVVYGRKIGRSRRGFSPGGNGRGGPNGGSDQQRRTDLGEPRL